eukprot:Gb_36334 [translate_table: standard]
MGRIQAVKGTKPGKKLPMALSKKKNQQQGGRRNKKTKNGNKGIGLPHLPNILKKELDNIHQKSGDDEEEDADILNGDDYEYEDGLPEEETKKNRRYDQVDKLEYELPSDFEDEEIDEDTAFGNEHCDQSNRVSASKGTPNGSGRGNQSSDVDLNSDDEDEMSEYQELSGESEHESDDSEEIGGQDKMNSRRQQLGDQSEEEEEEEEEEEDDDDEEDGERHQRMLQAVTGMSSDAFEGKKRRKKVVVSETYPESEYNLDKKASGANESVSVEDLMAPLYGNSGFGTLRKRMQQLEKKAVPLQAPLPKVVQERLERKAAYENTKEDITKWQLPVKKNREASTVNFVKKVDVGKTTTGAIAFDFNPTTSLEKEITSLLQDTGVVESQERDGVELLELNKLSVEQVRERQGRLAKMRSLLFRHELKAKHIKKIKSKTFHRLLKKDRTKAGLGEMPGDPEAAKEYAMKQEFKRAEERMTLKHKNTSKWAKRVLKRRLQTQDEGTQAAVAEQLRLNTLLTRKIHSMNDGSSSGESSSGDEDNAEIPLNSDNTCNSKVLAKAKEETLKILGGDEEETPKSGLLSLPFMVRGMEKRKKQAHDEAAAAFKEYESALRIGNNDVETGIEANDGSSGRLVFGELNRQTRKKGSHKSSKNEFDDMFMDKGSGSEGDSENEMHQDLAQDYSGTSFQKQVKTGPRIAFEESNFTCDEMHKEGSLAPQVIKTPGPVFVDGFNNAHCKDAYTRKCDQFGSRGSNLKVDFEEEMVASELQKNNSLQVPDHKLWLFGDSGQKTSEKMPIEIISVPRRKSKKQKNENRRSKQANEQSCISDVQDVNMRTKPGIVNVDAEGTRSKNVDKLSKPGVSNEDGSGVLIQRIEQLASSCSSEEELEKGVPSEGMMLINGIGSQADLIQRAFAGDDVEAEFEQVKAQAVNEEIPVSEGNVSLPGWGDWTNVQQKRGLPSWILKQQRAEKEKREEALRKRKDAKLKFVVISEKMDKKATKFNTPSLPFPYKSREVFERSMRMPLGPDFNTIRAFQDMIRPSVIKKAGVIIDPIKYEKQGPKDEKLDSLANTVKQKRPIKDQDHVQKKVKLRGISKEGSG